MLGVTVAMMEAGAERKFYDARAVYKTALKKLCSAVRKAQQEFIAASITIATDKPCELLKVVSSFAAPSALQNVMTHSAKLFEELSEFFFNKIQLIYEKSPAHVEPSQMTDKTPPSDPILDSFAPLMLSDVSTSLAKCKSGSPTDPCPLVILKQEAPLTAPDLLKRLNASLEAAVVPQKWKEAMLIPILMISNDDHHMLSHFHQISLLPAAIEMFTK
ncbi:hypothetical protein NDU88_001229 [Pleurodeles waltl]|uniref:Uncharacterized protein n=1 Tax=Pleurodeles waltl TaxID=8319 RepID=A0AAV7SZ01_PLEWA|nr:hypothetical protein NDU88_001229 [Pleurodeles waltl]